jgi:hypothetical protein
MASIDLKKTSYRDCYTATSTPTLVVVPPRKYVMIDGAGDPNTVAEYREAVEALYPIAYGLRAAVKGATGDAYVVMPLEGLWWANDMASFSTGDKTDWLWTAMICLPEAVTEGMVADVIPTVTAKKHLTAGNKARVETFTEGDAAQILHLGPYAAEAPTIARLHRFIDDNGYRLAGKHHEIYLSDPRKTDPAKLRTLIRQPVADA